MRKLTKLPENKQKIYKLFNTFSALLISSPPPFSSKIFLINPLSITIANLESRLPKPTEVKSIFSPEESLNSFKQSERWFMSVLPNELTQELMTNGSLDETKYTSSMPLSQNFL